MSKRRKPRNVRRQAQEAEELFNSDTGNPAAEGDIEGAEGPADTDGDDKNTPNAAQEPQPTGDAGEQSWHDKFLTLDGKYKAEVPRLHAEITNLRNTISERDAEIERLKSQGSQQAGSGGETESTESAISRLREEYGDELADALNEEVKRIEGAADKRVEQVEREVRDMRGETQQTRTQRFFTDLAEAVPDYQEINADNRFLSWLGEVDPMVGRTRQELLSEGEQQLNAQRVAAVFDAFKREHAPAEKPKQPQQSPNKGRNAEEPASKPTYTNAQIEKFYTDKRKGKYKRDPERARRIEREIFDAQAEGRVTG